MPMARLNIHVAPIDAKDWVVKEDGGREYGHYPSQQDAENVGQKLARKHKVQIIVRDRDGKVHRRNFSRGWFSRLFGR
jgi:uncharacterized protein DUF2188